MTRPVRRSTAILREARRRGWRVERRFSGSRTHWPPLIRLRHRNGALAWASLPLRHTLLPTLTATRLRQARFVTLEQSVLDAAGDGR